MYVSSVTEWKKTPASRLPWYTASKIDANGKNDQEIQDGSPTNNNYGNEERDRGLEVLKLLIAL